MNGKVKIWFWVLIVLCTIFLLVGGYYTYKYFDLKDKSENQGFITEYVVDEEEYDNYISEIKNNTVEGIVTSIDSEEITVNNNGVEESYLFVDDLFVEKIEVDGENGQFVTGSTDNIKEGSGVWLFFGSDDQSDKVTSVKILD